MVVNPAALGYEEGTRLVEGRTPEQLKRDLDFFNARFDECARRGATGGMILASGFTSAIVQALLARQAERLWFPDPASFVW